MQRQLLEEAKALAQGGSLIPTEMNYREQQNRFRAQTARAGIHGEPEGEWAEALDAARALPDDMLGPFLLVAKAARDGQPCPSDADLAASYGTSSLGRVRRLITYIESRELFVCRTDLSGKRSITIPRLGWTTQPADGA
jgi:hypothetical protein